MSKKALSEVRTIVTDHGFPARLLPDGVTDYQFDAGTGRFQVTLDKKTQVKRGGIPVEYDVQVSGTLEKGTLRNLRGVKAKQVFWVPVTAVEVEGDELAFAAGPIRRRLPLAEFA